MSAHPQSLPNLQLARLQELLDEAETDRTRLNRRIRRLRNLIRAVKNGDEMPDLAELFGELRPTPSVGRAPASPRPAVVAPVAIPQGVGPSGPMGPATRLGEGLPPGVPSPVAPPPPAGQLEMPSVDVGSLTRMSPEQLDKLPFGVVTLDSNGRVIGYNDTESRLAGLPRDAVIGRNFFGDVAPCTAVREFEGRFREFAEGRSRLALETFEFVFNFKRGAQRVVIMISPARQRGRFHVSMIRR